MIEPSTSPWSVQVVLASKKDGSYRYCVDFRRLNCVTVKEHYPFPRVEDMIDTLAGAKFFSTLDLISAYHAFEIHPDDREKTVFSTKQGHWQWKRVPFELCNAAPFFARQIASLLAGMTWEELLAFFDDVSVFSPTFAKHCEFLDRALTLIEEAGLKVKPEKCRILPQRVPFVGHILSPARSVHRSRKGFRSEIMATTDQSVSVACFSGKDWLLQKVHTRFCNPCGPPLPTRGKGSELCVV